MSSPYNMSLGDVINELQKAIDMHCVCVSPPSEELRNMTEEQLSNGDAIPAINKEYK
jgi:hypothetical protein